MYKTPKIELKIYTYNISIMESPSGSNEVKKTAENEQVVEVKKVEEVAEVKKVEEVEEVAEVKKVEEVTEVKKAEEVAEVKKAEEVAEVKKVEEVAEVKKVEEVAEVKKVEEVAEVKNVEEVAEVKKAEEVAEVKNVEEVAEVKKAEEVAEVKKVEEVAEVKNVEEMAEVKNVEEVAEVKNVEEVAEVKKVKGMAEVKKVEEVSNDSTSQFNIIETNISPDLVSKFSSDVLAHIFKYSKTTGTIDLNNDYQNILMSKKVNIVEYMNNKLGCNDIYDVNCTGVRVKKIDDNIRKKVAQWLLHDDDYYASFYFYIATPGSLFEAYLLVITCKKNAGVTEQLATIKDVQKGTTAQLTNAIEKINLAVDELQKRRSVESLADEIHSLIDKTTTQFTDHLRDLEKQVLANSADIQTTTKNVTTDVDTKTKDMMIAIDTKIENITKMIGEKMNEMMEKINGEMKMVHEKLNVQATNINKLQEMAHGMLHSEGDDFFIVK